MEWLIFTLATAIFSAAAMIVQKKVLFEEHAMEFSTVFSVINLILSIPLIVFIDFSKLTLPPIIISFGIGLLGSVAFVLIAKSIRHMELSSVTPLLVMGPGISSFAAFLILGEALTLLQIGGISLLILGSYVLEIKKKSKLLDPIKKLIKSKYVHYIIIALILYAFTAVAERFILLEYDLQVSTYILLIHIFLAFNFFIMLTIFHDGMKGVRNGFKKAGWSILLISLFTVTYRYTQMAAFKLAYVGLVLSIKRLASLFTVIIGGEIFHEKNLLRKSLATIIMIIGVLLIAL